MSDLKDPKMQKDILAQAVADIEGEFRNEECCWLSVADNWRDIR